MEDFSMTGYYNQYIEAVTACNRARQRVENLRSSVVYCEDQDSALATLEAAEAEYQAAKDEENRLWFLANTGKPREEVKRENAITPVQLCGGFKPHWPEPPKGRRFSR